MILCESLGRTARRRPPGKCRFFANWQIGKLLGHSFRIARPLPVCELLEHLEDGVFYAVPFSPCAPHLSLCRKEEGKGRERPPLVTAVQTVVPRNCDEDDEGNMQKRSYAM